MNFFRNIFVVLAVLVGFNLQAQLSATITTGTAGTPQHNAGPIYRSSASSAYDASRYSYLYTQAELAAAGINPGDFITSLGWTKNNNATATGGAIFRIYMKNSSATTYGLATETWANLNAGTTMVYENLNFTVPATQAPNYIDFTFTSPFNYTGGSLEISTEWDINQVTGNPSTGTFDWLWSTVPNMIYGTGQTVLANAGTLSATTNSIATIDDRRPFLKIGYTPGAPCTAPPTAGVAISSMSPVCATDNFTVSLSGASFGNGQTYQWESSLNGIDYTPIVGATNAGFATTQNQTTYYRAIVTCSGQSATSTAVQVISNTFLDCYCVSNATSALNTTIYNVSISTLNNSSTCSTTGGPGSIQNQYANYTTTISAPNLARGVNYPISVEVGTCGTNVSNSVKAYIDFNQNGSFNDPGEEILASTAGVVGPNIVSGSIIIPLGAVLGTTRMRVIVVQTTPANVNSCGTYANGETEDYFVTIAPAPSCPQPNQLQVLTASTSSADLTWNPNGTETSWEIVYGSIGFDPETSGTSLISTTNPSVNPTPISGLTANSFYQVYIRAICAPGDSSFFAGPVSFNTFGLGIYMESDVACGPGFTDISNSGTLLVLASDDESPVTLPFPFYYQGTLVTEATLGNNGGLVLNTITAQLALTNTILTTAANGLYPFWDNLMTTGPGVWTETIGTAPNRIFIAQWNKDASGAAGNPVNFQLQIHESNMQIYFLYDDVITGNTTTNFGASATIGVAGPNQDIQLSFNNANFLTENSCARFYYTDCPKPTNLTITAISQEEATINWAAGLSSEMEWTLEYGPTGFTPGSAQGTVLPDLTLTSQLLPNLTQVTTYDVYIYANCANGDTSNALFGTFTTLPNCATPTAVAASVDIDSLFVTWNYTQTISTIDYFNLQYGMTGFAPYTGTIVQGTFSNNADTIADAALIAGVSYQVYVQSVCTNGDTSIFAGPFSITMPLTNDTVCYAEMLNVDGTVYNFIGNGATVNNFAVPNEASIAPPGTGAQTTTGWINSTISRSTWFTFVAPATGQVRIDGTDNGFDGQLAVYEVEDCDDFGTFSLLAANDNAIGGSSLAPNFTVCGLTPGNTYYLMHDPFSATVTAFTYSIKITPISLEAGNIEPLTNLCYGDTLDLFLTINGNDAGGFWIPTNTNVSLVQDSLFASTGLAYQTFNFQYRMIDGCAYDSIVSQVKIFPPSSAGENGGMTVCRNQPINLLAGLGGVFQAGGTWYDPLNVALPNGAISAPNFPGNYNYDYIVGNGVCPDDTALVIVNVLGSCNYLDIASTEELELNLLTIYPNPTDGIVYITNESSATNYNYEVTDVQGKKIAIQENGIKAYSTNEIDLTELEAGIYFIRAYTENVQRIVRIIVR